MTWHAWVCAALGVLNLWLAWQPPPSLWTAVSGGIYLGLALDMTIVDVAAYLQERRG